MTLAPTVLRGRLRFCISLTQPPPLFSMPHPPPPPPHHSDNASGDFNGYDAYIQTPYNGFNPHLGANGTTRIFLPTFRTIGHKTIRPSYQLSSFLTCTTAMKDSIALWKTLSPATRRLWKPLAKRLRLPAYTAFLGVNIRRALNGLSLTSTP